MEQIKKLSVIGFIALILVNFGFMSDLAIIPTYGNLFPAFPDAPSWVVLFIMSGSQLTCLVSTLLSAVLMRYLSKKTILIGAFTLFAISACFGAVIVDAYYMALMRGICGLGFGALVPVAIALINEIYQDDKKKAGMFVGFFDGSMAMIGAIISIIAGYLAVSNWTNVYYQYWAAIPFLILMIIFIPKTPPQRETLAQLPQGAAKEKMPWGTAAAILFSFFMMNLLYCYMTYLSHPYVKEIGVGSSVLSGYLGFALSVASGCAGFLFVKTFGSFKRYTITFAYLLELIAYIGFSTAPGLFLLYIFYILMGFGFGTAISFSYVHAANVIPKSHAPQMFAFVAAAMGLGAFLATYVAAWVQQAMGTQSYLAICPVYAAVAGIGFVLSLILAIRGTKLGQGQEAPVSH